jgi:hypothetical protein
MNNIIQYTSRTYNTVMNDINSVPELRDKPEWFKKIWAGAVDVLSMILNAESNQSYLETAFTEDSVDALVTLIDYQRSPHSTASNYIFFDAIRTAIFPFTVLVSDLIAFSEGSFTVSSKKFEARGDETFSAVSETFTASSTTDLLTVSRIYMTGELVRLSSTLTLPTATGGDLDANTDYFAIYVSDTTIKLARSRTNSYNGTFIDLTSNGTGTLNIKVYSKKIYVYQQTSVSSQSIGLFDGRTEWQEFNIPDSYMLKDTLTVTINSITYTRVDTFVNSNPSDKVYKILNKSDNRFSIQFPDGTYGEIPPAFDIMVSYAYGGGSDSNVSVINKINQYGGSDINIDGVSNYIELSGGGDREGMATAKIIGPLNLKAQSRFVTSDDGIALALAYSGITRATVDKNAFGPLTAAFYLVPSGGGVVPAPTLADLATYLQNRSILESIFTVCFSANYLTVNVTSTLKIKTGYTFASVKEYYELALKLIFSESTYEIYLMYLDEGIASAVTLINTRFSYSFTDADYATISPILDIINPVDFGVAIQLGDVHGITDNVDGVDYSIISVPSFPVTPTQFQITTYGTITTTQIP